MLETIRGFAEKYSIGRNTKFGTEVTTVTRKSDRRYSQALYMYEHSWEACCLTVMALSMIASFLCSVLVSYTVVRSGETGTVCASSLFVASGILGDPSADPCAIISEIVVHADVLCSDTAMCSSLVTADVELMRQLHAQASRSRCKAAACPA